MYTLDTNIIIYYLKDDPEVILILRNIVESYVPLYVSTVTEIELFGYPNISPEEVTKIEEILQTTTSIPIDSRLARVAGALRSEHHMKTADSAIAATAMITGSTLLTRNIKDFKKIPHLLLQKV